MAAKIKKSDTSSASSRPSKLATVNSYFTESKAELKKVTWPSRKEVRVTSIAVLILVVITSIFLGVADTFLGWLIRLITGLGS